MEAGEISHHSAICFKELCKQDECDVKGTAGAMNDFLTCHDLVRDLYLSCISRVATQFVLNSHNKLRTA